MTSLFVIENKVSAIREYVKILEPYKQYSRIDVEKDNQIRGALERYLYLAAQATIDLAEAVIAFKKFRKPTTLSENFHILQEQDVISGELAEKLVSMVGFRNTIAHDYQKVNYDIVFDVLHNRLSDLEEFITAAKKNLNLG